MKRIYYLVMIAPILLCNSIAYAQSPIVKKNPGLDAIVDVNAEIVKIRDGFQFTEGPVWSLKGYLLFSDIPAEKIYQWEQVKGIDVYLNQSGGSNGLTYDAMGTLVLCQHKDRRIARLNKDMKMENVTDNYHGKKLNSPNDLVIKSDGTIYFTDPAYGLAKQEDDPAKEIPYQGVYRYMNGQTILLDSTLESPNGIAFSPDEKILYVANFNKQTLAKTWVKYKVDKKGNLGKRTVFADATESLEKGGPDGMKVDVAGNVYCAGPGGVLIYSPEGILLGLIRFPEIVANLCFGGDDGKTLFVTARTGLYSVKLKVEGIRPK